MKRSILCLLLSVLSGVAVAGISDWVSVVRVTSNYGEVSFEVLSNADYTARTKEAWSRNRVLTQASRLARDEWLKDEETKDEAFPGSVACKAELKRLKTFPDTTQADAYAAKMAEVWEAKQRELKATSYLEKRMKVLKDEIENAADWMREKEGWLERREDEIATLQVELSEREARDREREALADQAKDMIEEHIAALVAPTVKE